MKKYACGRLLSLGRGVCLASSEELSAREVLNHYSEVVGKLRDGRPIVGDERGFLVGCRELFEHTQAVRVKQGIALAASLQFRTNYALSLSQGELIYVPKG